MGVLISHQFTHKFSYARACAYCTIVVPKHILNPVIVLVGWGPYRVGGGGGKEGRGGLYFPLPIPFIPSSLLRNVAKLFSISAGSRHPGNSPSPLFSHLLYPSVPILSGSCPPCPPPLQSPSQAIIPALNSCSTYNLIIELRNQLFLSRSKSRFCLEKLQKMIECHLQKTRENIINNI